MLRIGLSLVAGLFISHLSAQKFVSVVESFCNTGKSGAAEVIPDLANYAEIADTSDLNELYIQYHVPADFEDWTDEYTHSASANQWEFYQNLGLAGELCSVLKNGVANPAEDWFDCTPEDKYIYGLARKVTVLFEDYDPETKSVVTEIVLAMPYSAPSEAFVHVLALESGIEIETTGGEIPGTSSILHNVVRSAEVVPATSGGIQTTLTLPEDANPEQVKIVAFVQDHTTGEILGGTRGISLEPYINAPGETFAVVENFVNSGCFGGPPAINSMSTHVEIAENNNENHALVQLHIGQTYGNWSDVYKLPLNDERYDKYSWDMGIIAGLAAVAKNGIRYRPHTWNNCTPKEKIATDFVDVSLHSINEEEVILNYSLSGVLNPHSKVCFYVVERDITVHVTGAEIPGTTLNMNNVARAARRKSIQNLSDTVALSLPPDIDLQKSSVLAYIQNDVTYEVTGGNNGFPLSQFTGLKDVELKGLVIAPNPVNTGHSFQIALPKAFDNAELSVYDLNGRIVLSRKLTEVPGRLAVADPVFHAGIYVVELKGGAEVFRGKLVVH